MVGIIIGALGGNVSPDTCKANLAQGKMTCNFLCGGGGNTSAAFMPQAMATICWGGDAGGGILQVRLARADTAQLSCS